jgi:rsbT co-antagonist protein RsbR
MATLATFIEEHAASILEDYLFLVRNNVDRYGHNEPPTFVENTRRLIHLMPRALADPHAKEVVEFVDLLCRQRLPMGFQLGDVLEAMFLYNDVITPLVVNAGLSINEQAQLQVDAQNAIEAIALRFAEAFVEMQMRVLDAQRQAVLELSTPVIKVWDGILTLPLIGTIDSYRAKQIMEELLREVAIEQAGIVLIDITGVPVVDTNVADHLIRTIKAAELLGTECLLVGIGPELAQTIVSLGVDLSRITSCADMRQGLTVGFERLGLAVVPKASVESLREQS